MKLAYEVEKRRVDSKEVKTLKILDGVSGQVNSQQMLALVGTAPRGVV